MHGILSPSNDKSIDMDAFISLHQLPDGEKSFKIDMPKAQTSPMVFASPHSGRLFPADFFSACVAAPSDLRRVEDAYVDQLFADAPNWGAPFLTALVSRACLDLNRASNELDAHIIDPPMKNPRPNRTPRVQAGLGCIPRVAHSGRVIYGRKLTPKEVQHRLDTVYRPYHSALNSLIDATRKSFGVSFLVDCHSMPSQSELGATFPEIVLGDRFGASCTAELTEKIENAFASRGYSVARNRPYAGGFITQSQGRPEKQRHALQIEINRKLYLDEENVKLSPNAEKLKTDIIEIFRDVSLWATKISSRSPLNK